MKQLTILKKLNRITQNNGPPRCGGYLLYKYSHKVGRRILIVLLMYEFVEASVSNGKYQSVHENAL